MKFARDRSDLFFSDVKTQVSSYLDCKGRSRFGGWRIAVKAAAFGTASALFYALAIAGGFSTAVTLLFAVLFGLSALLFAMNVGHDAAHDTATPHKVFNRVLQFIAFAPLGADAGLWRLRHVKSHHISPNVSEFDVDSAENGFVRLSPFQKRRWFHRGQAFYSPFVFWLVDIHAVLLNDFQYLVSGRMANIEGIGRDPKTVFTFALQKAAFIAIMFAIPYAVMDRPWTDVILGALIVTFINSLVFVYMLIGTHHCEETAYLDADQAGSVPHGWAYHQLATSMDWSPLSPVANFVAGGANAHAAHHLFPNISHVHYMPITPIIQEAAALHGMPYHQSTLPRMLASHFRHLHKLGQA